jgi:hypothetical protein
VINEHVFSYDVKTEKLCSDYPDVLFRRSLFMDVILLKGLVTSFFFPKAFVLKTDSFLCFDTCYWRLNLSVSACRPV